MTNCLTLTIAFALLANGPAALVSQQEGVKWSIETEDGILLYGESFGAGADLLFVHGGPSFPPLQMPEWLVGLSDTHRVHVFHQRGSGLSSRLLERLPEDEDLARATLLEVYGVEPHLADIGRVLDSLLAQENAVTLIGHSFGAYLAALYAARQPGRIAQLVLLAPADVLDGSLASKPLFERIQDSLPEAERDEYRRRMDLFLSPTQLSGATDSFLATSADWFGWYFLQAMGWSIPRPDTYPTRRWVGGCAVAGVFLGLEERGDATPSLARIRARTLVLHAESDLTSRSVAAGYTRAIPGARMHTIPHTSHFFRSESSATAARIEDFLTTR